MRVRRGFTLVELLVVIGIIAVLAALLAPVYVNMKKQGKKAACQSNLRQISKAFGLYLYDYNSCYPSCYPNPLDRSVYIQDQYMWAGANWRWTLQKYVAVSKAKLDDPSKNMILSCPNDPIPSGVYAGTSYAYSASFYMTPEQVNMVADNNYMRSALAVINNNPILPCTTIKESLVRFATKKVMITEYWTLHSGKSKVGWYDNASSGNDPWSGARNYLFADGHVVYLPTSKIRPAVSPLVARPRSLPDINLTTDGVAGRDIN